MFVVPAFIIKYIILSSFIFQPLVGEIGRVPNKAPVAVPAQKFDFGSSAKAGYTKVNVSTTYSDGTGFGFEQGHSLTALKRNSKDPLGDGFVTSNKPFSFSVKLPEGNYQVKFIVGDIQGISDMVIRAECRRMMTERIITKPKEIKTLEFTVHIRDSLIRPLGKIVRLKDREINYLHWDNKLTLEFLGVEPKLCAIEITRVQDVTTVFLAGNSTVVDQAYEPYAAWGQIIPAFFEPRTVSVANYAESGESLSSFIAEKRFEKILSLIKRGDFAFVEFGHNDQKQKGDGIGAFTSYKKDLKYFITEVKNKGGIPVLVTSMHRRNFDSAGRINQTLGDYPEAVRQTAFEEKVSLIDLNALSKILYEAWGPEESKAAFVIYPANTFPGQTTELKDNTHFNPYGAYEIARCIVKSIQENIPDLSKYLRKGIKPFNPAKPDPLTDVYWPLSPSPISKKPDGN